MHFIKTPHTGVIRYSGSKDEFLAAIRMGKQAQLNKLAVLEGALNVERMISYVIAHHFHPNDKAAWEEFYNTVVNSDWCSFSAKRKLIEHIIHKRKLINGKELSNYQKLLRDTMAYRNAFTHGAIEHEYNAFWLVYFEGVPRRQELTDAYLMKVEGVLNNALEATEKLAVRVGFFEDMTPERAAECAKSYEGTGIGAIREVPRVS